MEKDRAKVSHDGGARDASSAARGTRSQPMLKREYICSSMCVKKETREVKQTTNKPSKGLSSGPTILAIHVNKSVSEMGLADTPGGHSDARDFKSLISRKVAARRTSPPPPPPPPLLLPPPPLPVLVPDVVVLLLVFEAADAEEPDPLVANAEDDEGVDIMVAG